MERLEPSLMTEDAPADAAKRAAQAEPMRLDSTAFAALGPGQLRAGRDTDAIDERIPAAVITARENEQVRTAVLEARRQKLGLIVAGGATDLHIGNPPRDYDLRLVTTALGEVLERNPEEMTVSVQAGVPLARLNRNLEPLGQRVAIDVCDPARATIGGIVAAASTGGLRYGYGEVRDLVLALQVVDGTGRSYRSGAGVVKNVAGYDLCRLFTGSRGSLAIITEITLRTHPIPEAAATAFFEFETPSAADSVRAALFAAALPLAALDLSADCCDGRSSWTLAVRAEGTAAEVETMILAAEQEAGHEPAGVEEDWQSPAFPDADCPVVFRMDVAPTRLINVARELLEEASTRKVNVLGGAHLGSGILRVGVDAARPEDSSALLAQARAAVIRGGGTLTLEKAPLELKRTGDVFGTAPVSLRLMSELKKRLDPDGILAPGRGVGGI
jgi:glycolate oxidase FAD binding subunit